MADSPSNSSKTRLTRDTCNDPKDFIVLMPNGSRNMLEPAGMYSSHNLRCGTCELVLF